jgi:ribosomal protein S12 methylthiotransferase accessory factor
MNRILRFQPHLRVEVAGDGMVFLVGEIERFMLKGRLHQLVAPLLDGRRSEWEIVEALAGHASPPEVMYALTVLEQKGYIGEAPADVPPEIEAFWRSLGVDAARAVERLGATPVTVIALDGSDRGPLVRSLADAGVALREDAELRIVLTGDYLDRGLDELNRRAQDERFRWMPVKAGGVVPWIGPIFRPGDGPCWECLAHRLRLNRPVETYLGRRLRRGDAIIAPPAHLAASRHAALDLAALTLARWIAEEGRGAVTDKLLALDLRRMRLEEHAVMRRPECPACGDPDLPKKRVEQPVVLEPRPKRYTEDGGYRCVDPEQTYARYEHLISPITGIVTSVGPSEERHHPMRQVHGSIFFICPEADRSPAFEDFSRPCMGKGRTAAQSRTGALCEAIERHSTCFRGDEPRVRARFSELGGAAVHPHVLLQFSEKQYREREERNRRTREPRQAIPLPFDEDVPIDWTPVWSLSKGERRYLPTAFCYLGVPVAPGERFCELNPNGHAAGNCVEEAILQGFFELCERDAVGIWWYNRVRRPAVDLASFDERYFLDLTAHYQALGYRVWVLDVTTDMEVPAFVALGHDAAANRWTMGLGCHRDAKLGVLRALTEMNQLFDPRSTRHAPWSDQPIEDASFLLPDERAPARKSADYAEARRGDLRADVTECVECAARLGLETLVLDQTRPDVGLNVVKVTVPGLRHMWPRFRAGRLQEAPVRLGWLPEPLQEAQLNPVPLYL